MIPVSERMYSLRSLIVLCLVAWTYSVLSRDRKALDALRLASDPNFDPLVFPVEAGIL